MIITTASTIVDLIHGNSYGHYMHASTPIAPYADGAKRLSDFVSSRTARDEELVMLLLSSLITYKKIIANGFIDFTRIWPVPLNFWDVTKRRS